MIRILIVDRDAVKLEQTKDYLQNFEDFKISASEYDDEAADEIRDDDFDIILYSMSDKSNPEILFEEETNFSFLVLVKGDISGKTYFQKYPEIKTRYIENCEGSDADLAEIIRTSYTLHNIEGTISKGMNKYKNIFLKAPAPLAIINDAGRIIDVNSEWAKTLEYERNEMAGHEIYSFVQKKDADKVKKVLISAVKSIRNEKQTGTVTIFTKKDGNSFPARIYCSGIYDETEKSDRLLCTFTDITSQNASLKSLNFKSRLFDTVGTCVSSVLHSKSVRDDISNILHILGITLEASRVSVFLGNEDIISKGVYSKKFEWSAPEIMNCPDNVELLKIQNFLESNNDSENKFLTDKPLLLISGNTKENIQKILDKCGTLSLIRIPVSLDSNKKLVILIEDCKTKTKWDQEDADTIIIASNILGMILKLKHIDFKNISIIEDSPDIIGIINKDGLITYSNNAVNRLLGICNNDTFSYNIADLFQKENSARLKLQIDSSIKEKKSAEENYSFFFQNKEYTANLLMYPIKNEFGIKNIIFFGRDITKQKQFEERLLLTQFAVESSPDSVYYIDKSGKIIYANKSACKLLNYSKSELLQKSAFELNFKCTSEIWKKHWSKLKKQNTCKYKAYLTKSDDALISVEIAENYLNVSGFEIICSYVREIPEINKK